MKRLAAPKSAIDAMIDEANGAANLVQLKALIVKLLRGMDDEARSRHTAALQRKDFSG